MHILRTWRWWWPIHCSRAENSKIPMPRARYRHFPTKVQIHPHIYVCITHKHMGACTIISTQQATKVTAVICTNQVVLAERGNCQFPEKALNIQKAGGIAAIIYNHE